MMTPFLRRAIFSALLVCAVSTGAMAQEGAMPGATGGELPFINEGANRPVLQTISPDGVALEPHAMQAPDIEAHAAAAEAAHHGAEHKKGLPQFDVTTFPKQIAWLGIIFVIMYVAFSRMSLPSIQKVMDERAKRIAHDIESAEAIKGQVEALRIAYETSIAKAQADAMHLMSEEQDDIKNMIANQDATFRDKADAEVQALESRIDAMRGDIMAELKDSAAQLGVDIAARVSDVRVDVEDARKLVANLSAGAA